LGYSAARQSKIGGRARLLKLAMLYRRRRFGTVRAIIDVPLYLRK